MMIEANIRRLSRMELLYACISKLVCYLHKQHKDELLAGLEHYYDPNDFNQLIYHNRDQEATEKISDLLKDADLLLERCVSDYDEVTEYQLLVRCLSEQTVIENAVRRLKTKADGEMNSDMLQNPSDPEATFRSKAGKDHRGYAANMEETVGSNGSVVTDYDYQKNNYSDSQFIKDHLKRMDKQEEPITVITDGAYSGKDNQDLAASKNVTLVHTDLTGRDVSEIYADFIFSDDGKKVMTCPAGNTPKSCSYMKSSDQCRVSFEKDKCANCPHKENCKAVIHKRVSVVIVSVKATARAKMQKSMRTEEFKNLARLRNGVEAIPSILRKKYHVDDMPVRGKIPGKLHFGCKIAALNVRKFFNYKKGLGQYAQNPVLA